MNKTIKILVFFLFLVALYFPLFLHLDVQGLYHWDESRNAISAFEMTQNGNPIVRYYNGIPDSWETKPPFLTWLQVISYQLVGYNELGVRLPAALAGLFTILLLLHFFYRELDDLSTGLFIALILVTTPGYIDFHVTRTGDHDAVLIFFLLVGLIAFYKLLKYPDRQNRYLGILTIALVCGVLTKSIAGLFFGPGILFYALYKRKLLYLLRQPKVYLSAFTFFACVGLYYWLRDQMQAGYIQTVWNMELLPRYLNKSKGISFNNSDPWYYTHLIRTQQFWPYVYLLPLALLMILIGKAKRYTEVFVLFAVTALLFLYSISKGTVNSWYVAPIYPLLAIIAGLGLSLLFRKIGALIPVSESKKIMMGFVIAIALFAWPYQRTIKSVYFPSDNTDHYGDFMEEIAESQANLKSYFVFYEWRNSAYIFYEKIYNAKRGYRLESCGVRGQIEKCENQPKVGQHVMICNDDFRQQAEEKYILKKIDQYKSCQLYKIERISLTTELLSPDQ